MYDNFLNSTDATDMCRAYCDRKHGNALLVFIMLYIFIA